MSRATISTGSIAFDAPKANRGDAPGYVLVLGDFSGSASRGIAPTPKLRAISRDNFDEVFAALAVQLKLPLQDEPLRFAELDELHPDFLYEQFDLFADLRDLDRRLRDRNTFDAAAAEMGAAQAATANTSHAGFSLDELLRAPAASAAFDVQALIRDIVGPHVIPAASPQQAPLLQAVSNATSGLLRSLMHHSAFQALEASWRGLYLLLRRIDGDREPPLFLLDCTNEQLPSLLAAGGDLERLLQKAGRADEAPRLLLADFEIGATEAAIASATALAEFAERNNTIAIAAGATALAGCADLRATPEPDDWSAQLPAEVSSAWQTLRGSSAARSLFLTAPKFLLRLPYGKRTSRTERLSFEESIDASNAHYLWGNGAWLAALSLLNDTPQIEQLPLHNRGGDDESFYSCTEITLHDRAAAKLKLNGLLPLRAVNGTDTILIPDLVSVGATREMEE